MPTPTSLKQQAENIIIALDQEMKQEPSIDPKTIGKADKLLHRLIKVVNDVDLTAAEERVYLLKQKNEDASTDVLIRELIQNKCRQTATVGAATAGIGLLPGVGTIAALVFGTAADIGATFRLQAELVLEIASLYQHRLDDQEKQRLVLLITGLSAGTAALTRKLGQQTGLKLGEKFAEKSFLKALPVIGVIASAGTNVLSTYIIGQRADAYFRLGEDGLQSWAESLRAITGVDEREIGQWLSEGGRTTTSLLAGGTERASQAGKQAGLMVIEQAQKGAALGKKGFLSYLNWVLSQWRRVFSAIGKAGQFTWNGIIFIPKKISKRFKQKKER